MTISLGSMIRLVVLIVVGSSILAVGVSRLDPPKAPKRFLRPVTSFQLDEFLVPVDKRESCWLDSETGDKTMGPVEDDILDFASCSPWVDDLGRRQVVGRWSNRTWRGTNTVMNEFGLGRFSFPDGRILDRIPSEVCPKGPPCWVPGMPARVVFAAGDGQLYRFDFESDDPTAPPTEASAPAASKPTALTWGCPKPEGGSVLINDLSWPGDARMGGRLVAAMRVLDRRDGANRRFSTTRLWWLQLDHSATRIVGIGPLVEHDLAGPSEANFDERSPIVQALPDGSLGLAYTRRIHGLRDLRYRCLNRAAVIARKCTLLSDELGRGRLDRSFRGVRRSFPHETSADLCGT